MSRCEEGDEAALTAVFGLVSGGADYARQKSKAPKTRRDSRGGLASSISRETERKRKGQNRGDRSSSRRGVNERQGPRIPSGRAARRWDCGTERVAQARRATMPRDGARQWLAGVAKPGGFGAARETYQPEGALGDERRVADAGRRREVEEEGGREIDAPAALQPGGIERWMGGCGSLFVHPFQAGLEGKVIEFGGASKGGGGWPPGRWRLRAVVQAAPAVATYE
ncbi:hypothetical protein Purlil1_4853 [Purpureocillium lilacinum]|uniref:Uncharacterized protein n=1 Tax=Purpureocillium lilacinum TaxID=33203 RepID=A0ABR0C3D6_PURLI|nr:hypothetical protein Purlil1_4853 [Purpureocillium lilacinum]